ncbi:dihydrofolate reductase [Vibrio phage RYC]|nr:dihydrofolate reductase [Vibrio phage RYC]
MTVKLIVCSGLDGAIGKNNKLLWNIPEDLAYFKKQTEGSTVLMGRKTLESLPFSDGLPNRENLCLTSKVPVMSKLGYQGDPERPSVLLCNESWVKSMLMINNKINTKDIWIIGGKQVYDLCLPYVQEIHHTLLGYTCMSADTFIDIDWESRGFRYSRFEKLADEVIVDIWRRD